MVLQQDIGRKSAMAVGLAHLGIKASAVELIPLVSRLEEKKYWTAWVNVSPTIDQQLRKKFTLNPSGPGLLFRFMELRTLKISESEMGAPSREA